MEELQTALVEFEDSPGDVSILTKMTRMLEGAGKAAGEQLQSAEVQASRVAGLKDERALRENNKMN